MLILASKIVTKSSQQTPTPQILCEERAGAVAQSLSQFSQAGDVIVRIRTTAGLPISMAEFSNRRTVTQFQFIWLN